MGRRTRVGDGPQRRDGPDHPPEDEEGDEEGDEEEAEGPLAVRVVVVFGARTGLPGRELSAAGFAEMTAALRARERRVEPVPEREPQLRRHGRVVLTPVREEVP